MATLALITGLAVVLNVRKTESGSAWPGSVMTCDAVNGWLKTRSKYTVYSWDWPSLFDSPQKSPLVTEPWISVGLTTVALVAASPFWLAMSLTRKSAAAVRGNLKSPMALCGVAVNDEVM